MKELSKILFLILICSLMTKAYQEHNISAKGKVIDIKTKEPLVNANIFLAGTTIGTTTDSKGEFLISNIPYGSYNIVFSYVGYEKEIRNIASYQPHLFEYNISLKIRPISLNQITINASIPRDWTKNLEIFKRIFIGETANSRSTKILNPEILNFEEAETGKFKASSNNVLMVENKALGYMIYIVLDSLVYLPETRIIYKFYPRFEEITPAANEEKEEWIKNRQNTFLDSPKHFYYSLVHNQLQENYFTLRNNLGILISPEDLEITCDKDSTIYEFNYTGQLEVYHYFEKKSILDFLYPSVAIDKYGNLISYFFSVETSGYWGDKRIADLLPSNYTYNND